MRVGTRRPPYRQIYSREDHPHACGDKYFLQSKLPHIRGSSPCVWGQVAFCYHYYYITRIIPMRVGTSIFFASCSLSAWDHPHACGDKVCVHFIGQVVKGSSPCVWGQVKRCLIVGDISGIIPMRVGTRYTSHCLTPTVTDHPHACGDKQWWT